MQKKESLYIIYVTYISIVNDQEEVMSLNQIENFLNSPLIKKRVLKKIHRYKKILAFKRNKIIKKKDLKDIHNLKNYTQRFIFYVERFPFQNKIIYDKKIVDKKNSKLQKQSLSFKGLLMLDKFLLN